MTKCRRRQARDPQKLKKLSTVVFSFLLVKAEAVGEIAASTSLVSTVNSLKVKLKKMAHLLHCRAKIYDTKVNILENLFFVVPRFCHITADNVTLNACLFRSVGTIVVIL